MESKQISIPSVKTARSELLDVGGEVELPTIHPQSALAQQNAERLDGIDLDMAVLPADRQRRPSVSANSLDSSNSQWSDDGSARSANVRDEPLVIGEREVIAFDDKRMQTAFLAADHVLRVPDLSAIVAHYVGPADAVEAPAPGARGVSDRAFTDVADGICITCGAVSYLGVCGIPAYLSAEAVGLGIGATVGLTALFTVLYAAGPASCVCLCCCKK